MNTASFAVLIGLSLPAAPPDGVRVPDYEEFVVVPVRVHVLTTPGFALADCTLADDDIARVFDHLNATWHRVGVHFGIESTVREPAEQVGRFRLTRELRNDRPAPNLYQMLLPRSTRVREGVNAYFFRNLPFNGVYFGDDSVVVREDPQLTPVEGGGDDPLARVTGHHLGHALGLPLHPDPANLMSNATTGVALNAAQADGARKVARTIRGAGSVSDIRKAARAAESNGSRETAIRLWGWLSEVPGTGAALAMERRARLQNP